MRDKGKFFHH